MGASRHQLLSVLRHQAFMAKGLRSLQTLRERPGDGGELQTEQLHCGAGHQAVEVPGWQGLRLLARLQSSEQPRNQHPGGGLRVPDQSILRWVMTLSLWSSLLSLSSLGHWALDQPDISEGHCVQSHLSEGTQEWELSRWVMSLS